MLSDSDFILWMGLAGGRFCSWYQKELAPDYQLAYTANFKGAFQSFILNI